MRNEIEGVTEDDKLFAMLIYLLSFFLPIVAPLIIWLLKRDDSSFVDYHGKEYFNFFISITVYGIISGILVILLIGILLLIILGIGTIILTIVAAVRSFQGERYRFPFIFRLIQ